MDAAQYRKFQVEPAHLSSPQYFERLRQDEANNERACAADASTRSKMETELDDAHKYFGVHDEHFKVTLWRYIEYLARTNRKAQSLQPERPHHHWMYKSPARFIRHMADADDYVQNLWIELMEPLSESYKGSGKGVPGFSGDVPFHHWVNSVFNRCFCGKFTEQVEADQKATRLDIFAPKKLDDSAHRGDKATITEERLYDMMPSGGYEDWYERNFLSHAEARRWIATLGSLSKLAQWHCAPHETDHDYKEKMRELRRIRADFAARRPAISKLVTTTDLTGAKIAKKLGVTPSNISKCLDHYHDLCVEAGLNSMALGSIFSKFYKPKKRRGRTASEPTVAVGSALDRLSGDGEQGEQGDHEHQFAGDSPEPMMADSGAHWTASFIEGSV